MFRGLSAVNIDSKGRVSIPNRYHETLEKREQKQVIVTIDTDSPCLLLYPLHEWLIIEAKLVALPSFQPAARRIQRLILGHATEIEIDANKRVLLPALLREYAKLDKSILLVGQGKKIEIWSEQEWEQHRNQWLNENSTSPLPDDLQSLSL